MSDAPPRLLTAHHRRPETAAPLVERARTVQELKSENDALEAKIRDMQARLEAAEARAAKAQSKGNNDATA